MCAVEDNLFMTSMNIHLEIEEWFPVLEFGASLL
jgi:hypothetical protein